MSQIGVKSPVPSVDIKNARGAEVNNVIVSNKAIERIAQILYGRTAPVPPKDGPSPAQQPIDKVTLSPEGRELQALQRRLAELPEVRAEKVQALRERILRGEYHVPAEAIAERLLERNDALQ